MDNAGTDLAVYMEGLTAADFETEAPYQWLYRQKLSRFEQRRALNLLMQCAVKVGVRRLTVQQYWNDYLADQKPAKVVGYGGDSVTNFPDQDKVIGDKTLASGKYLCDLNGVSYVGTQGEWVQVLPHPLLPVKRIVDVESGAENLQVAYCRLMQHQDGTEAVWKTLVTPRETLASAQKVITLARNGIAVNSENAKEVVKYLAEIENLNYSRLDTQLSCSHMGWMPDGTFAPYTDRLTFSGESDEFLQLYGGFRTKGSMETWLDVIRGVRQGESVPARIALAASFAAPLVKKLNALSFFVHLWGMQGTGKTVALLMAASVWCDPEIGRYVKTFSGTKVSQEVFAAFCGNLPVLLDELQVMADRKSFDDLIYALCEGVSKGRGSKDGGLQTSKRWSTVFLTTGEMPIVQSNSGGGAAVRTIEVNYWGTAFFQNARDVAETLKKNYGFAGREFIKALMDEKKMDEVAKRQSAYYKELSGQIQDKQVLSASLLLAADWLATEILFRDGRALTVDEIKPYLITQEQADVNARSYQYLVGWIAANQKRFSRDSEENNGEPWGLSEMEEGRAIVYIIRGAFERAMHDGGYSPGAFLSWAKQRRILKTQRADSNTIQKSIGRVRPLCVAVYLPEKEEEQKPDDAVEVDEDLPFMH